jgi:cation transport regulator ChaC
MREGFGNIMKARGGSVHGVLWRLTPRDLAALHTYEKVAAGLYRTATLTVVADRRRLAALVYLADDRAPGKPKSGYMEIVTSAARDAGLPDGYIRGLARIARAGPVIHVSAGSAAGLQANGR